jgi:1-acyl-sn-glycerol-3-phosphate acyltransferase
LKNIFGKIMAVWAIIVFVITMWIPALILWVIGLVDEPRRTQIFRATVSVWMRIFFFFTGCGFKIRGKENFKPGENYIVTCNHNSLMDVPCTTPFIPGANKTIAKIEMAKIPIFGLIYKRGSVLVDRKNKDSRKESFSKMKAVLNMGMHMCIYPEGSRNKTDQPLTPFHDGAFKLAVETGKSIIPTLIFNTKKVMPVFKGFYFWPAKMEMHFLPEIPAEKGADYEVLKEKVYKVMEEYYAENQ